MTPPCCILATQVAVEPDWNTILSLFEEALDRPAGERAEWLREKCGSDDRLLTEVQRLLTAHERDTGLLEQPINPLAVEALEEEELEQKQIGPYRVLREIGRGGMGVVYCAEDTKLGRQVALKALPGPYTADPRRMARFRREAQTLASLNHPNIASLYGLEDSGDAPVLVMELVDGSTLSEQIHQQPIPIEEVLPIASQLAKALEAAHDKGVIHRDLKPANIKVKTDGTVKVLDFGIAKALDEREVTETSRDSPVPFPTTTPTGLILGTAGYMSPEQARGKAVDKRSDIWAFGVVLYEMLTGRQAFGGDSAGDSVAAIIRGVPDWQALPNDTPRAVKQLLLRCLEKDPRRRLRDVGEARIVLDDLMDPHTGEVAVGGIDEPPSPAVSGKSAAQSWIGWIVAAALLAVAIAGWLRVGESPNGMVRKLELPVTGRFSMPVISPDGRRVAFLHEERVWVRDLDRLSAREIPDSDGAESVFWSPDSAWVGFGAKDRLRKAPATGGGASVICLVPGGFYPDASGAWIDGDRILFSTGGSGLLEVSANGGDPVEVVATDKELEIDFHGVNPLPDGRGVVFVGPPAGGDGHAGRVRRRKASGYSATPGANPPDAAIRLQRASVVSPQDGQPGSVGGAVRPG